MNRMILMEVEKSAREKLRKEDPSTPRISPARAEDQEKIMKCEFGIGRRAKSRGSYQPNLQV